MQIQDRREFWLKYWDRTEFKQSSFLDKPFCKGFKLTDEELKTVRRIVFEIIHSSFDQDCRRAIEIHTDPAARESELLAELNKTASFRMSVSENLDKYVHLEKQVLDLLFKRNLLSGFRGVQFPMDVRVVHAEPPPEYLKRPDAVDFLHCDAWRGEPSDLVNCVLYLHVGAQSSQLEVIDVPETDIEIMESYAGPENEANEVVKGLNKIDFDHQPGQAIFFDAYTPHRTKRNGNEVRISINFSFRRFDPYSVIDHRWSRARQNWSKFWYLPASPADTFEERANQESEMLSKTLQTRALELRTQYIAALSKKQGAEGSYES